jgi:hypothetical protein
MFLGLLDPDQDPLVRGMDPRIQIRTRIHTKMSWIRYTGLNYNRRQFSLEAPFSYTTGFIPCLEVVRTCMTKNPLTVSLNKAI